MMRAQLTVGWIIHKAGNDLAEMLNLIKVGCYDGEQGTPAGQDQ